MSGWAIFACFWFGISTVLAGTWFAMSFYERVEDERFYFTYPWTTKPIGTWQNDIIPTVGLVFAGPLVLLRCVVRGLAGK